MFKYLQHVFEAEYNQLSYWYFFSFAIGIIYSITTPIAPVISIIAFTLCTVMLLLISRIESPLYIWFVVLCIVMFFLGISATQYRIYLTQTTSITKSQIVDINAYVDKIKPNQYGNQLTLTQTKIPQLPTVHKVRINMSNKISSGLSVGDKISLRAKLFPLNSSILPEGYNFSFFLKMEKIQATGYAISELKIIDRAQIYISYIDKIRKTIYLKLINVLGAEIGNFAAAIIIGETKAIPQRITDAMRKTGTSHILSVSGLHLSLVALSFFIFSRTILNISNLLAYNTNIKTIAACISIIGSFIYLQISGNNIAAVRAFIMTSIFMIAVIFSRSPYPMRSVLLAAFFILLIMPEYILHPSFQLSFVAVMCLISGYEFYSNSNFIRFKSYPVIDKFISYFFANIYTSLLASIFTTPFVIFHFYQFANYAVIMNLIAVPLMSFVIMPLSILALLLMPFQFEVYILSIIGYFIDIIINSADYISKLPYAVVTTGYITRTSLLVFTIGFCWICFWQGRKRYLGLVVMAYSIWMMSSTPTPDIIIDKERDILAIKAVEKIILYSPYKLSSFTKLYWENWYAMPIQNILKNIWKENYLLKLKNGKTLSVNYNKCIEADLMIITSQKLICHSDVTKNKLIEIQELVKQRQLSIFLD
ncbi:MAG: ComEC/Rec2 family competence protein [Rickettsiaceae bacterium]|nr:ComEC/Rec2 family competence protein [Rickettsiaceae bacterium]